MAEAAVICLGNPDRTDDGVGGAVADELMRRRVQVPVFVSHGEPGALLELWDGYSRIVMVDAVVTGHHQPGTVQVLDAAAGPIAAGSPTSSHGFGLVQAIELARSLDRLPARLMVVGVEAGSLTAGAGLTESVAAAIPEVVDCVIREVGHA